MTDKPELVSTLTGYSECRCILSQYCDGKCRPIYELKPAAHLTIPGALEWDGDNGTHGVVGTHSADGESCSHGDAEALAIKLRQLRQVQAKHSKERDDLCTQLANTEQSRRSFFDLSQDLEKRLAERDALLRESSEWIKANSFGGCDAVDLWERIDATVPTKCESCGDWGHIETEDSAYDCPECGPSVVDRAVEAGVMNAPKLYAADDIPDFTPGSGNKARRRIEAIQKAKPKTCIECDQPYCHGVCVERGDQDYDRDQAAKGCDDE